jgi:hypothetical protein
VDVLRYINTNIHQTSDIYCYDNNNGNSSLSAMGSTENLNADRRKRVPRNWRMPFTLEADTNMQHLLWSLVWCVVVCRSLFILLQELITLLEHMSSPPVFSGVRVTQSLVLCVVVCRSLFVLLQELITLPEHLSSLPVFNGVRVTQSLVLCVVFCRSLFVILSFFFWPLCCLFFFDLQILIIPLVS